MTDFSSLHFATNLIGLRRHPHLCTNHNNSHPPNQLSTAAQKIFAKSMTPTRLAKLMDTEIFHSYTREDVDRDIRDNGSPFGCFTHRTHAISLSISIASPVITSGRGLRRLNSANIGRRWS